MKLRLYNILFYMSILIMILSFLEILDQSSGRFDEMKMLSEPVPVSRIDRIYVPDSDTIIVHNYIRGIIQCFNLKGDYKWGIHISTTKNINSTQVSCRGKDILLWEKNTNLIYFFVNDTLEKKVIDTQISDNEDFYNKYPMKTSHYNGKFKLNGKIHIENISKEECTVLKLNTSFSYFSFWDAFFGLLIGALGAIVIKNKHTV